MSKLKEKRIDRRVEVLESQLREVHAIAKKLADENTALGHYNTNLKGEVADLQQIIARHGSEMAAERHRQAQIDLAMREFSRLFPQMWEHWDGVKEYLGTR